MLRCAAAAPGRHGFVWNGGFEASVQPAGLPDGFFLTWGGDESATAVADARLAHSGQHSLRLRTPTAGGGLLLKTAQVRTVHSTPNSDRCLRALGQLWAVAHQSYE